MAMRVTTKMMQNTSLNNLNTNKALQEKLTTQLSTMKKITRPSDDPVIAIRSLKLNSSLNKIDQYYEKNSEDAESWLQLTEAAIKTSTDILTSMRKYVVQAAQGTLTADDRKAIIENLSNYEKEIYSTGNADSAGRSIFTGYRTDLPLTFTEDKEEKYTIIEQRNNSCIDSTIYVRTGELASINEGNFNADDKKTTEYNVASYEIPRIRLAYENVDIDTSAQSDAVNAENISINVKQNTIVDEANNQVEIRTASYIAYVSMDASNQEINISFSNPTMGNVSVPVNDTNPTTVGDLKITASDGTLTISDTHPPMNITMEYVENAVDNSVSFHETYNTEFIISDYETSGSDEAYDLAVGDGSEDKIVYIAETGELLLGKNVNAELSALPLDAEIQLKYNKSEWQEGDLDPIHYFYTERYDYSKVDPETKQSPKVLVYNEEKLEDPTSQEAKQIIEYDIGSNQSIRVNTTADEVFTHDIGRDVDEVIAMIDEYSSIEETYNTVNAMIKSEKYEGDELEKLKTELAALDKAKTMVKEKVQTRCEALITDFDEYLDQASLAQTNVGSRESRLLLIQNRLSSQQTNFQELVSENEDADVTDLAIQLSSVELTYEAALSSISYVMQTTLLDFI